MPIEYTKAKALRTNLTPIMGLLALIDDMVCELRAKRGGASDPGREALRDRTLDLQARASAARLRGPGSRAVELLAAVRTRLDASRRDSRNRMGYSSRTWRRLLGILAIWLAFGCLSAPAVPRRPPRVMTDRDRGSGPRGRSGRSTSWRLARSARSSRSRSGSTQCASTIRSRSRRCSTPASSGSPSG